MATLKTILTKINADKSFFARDNLEYFCLKISRQRIMPLPDIVQAMKDISILTNEKQLRSFIGVIDYYREIWGYMNQMF